MDLKNYGKENINDFAERVDKGNLNQNEQDTLSNLKAQYGNQVEELISKFQNMDETQLLSEIFKIINKQKQEGTFNPENIKNIAQTIKPLLNAEQQSKLEDLLKIISL